MTRETSAAAIDYGALHAEAEADGRRCVVGALILDDRGRAFVHRRSPERRFPPGCWDLVGGHVEPGESLLKALAREVVEETGWQLRGTPQLIHVVDWEAPDGRRREFDFLVDVEGDLTRPRLEVSKHVEYRWLAESETALLDENRGEDGGVVRRLVELSLRSAHPRELTYPHAMVLFVDLAPAHTIRARWDPAMASQIAAHVTLVFPSEVDGIDDLRGASRACRESGRAVPLAVRFGAMRGRGRGVGVRRGWRSRRRLVAAAAADPRRFRARTAAPDAGPPAHEQSGRGGVRSSRGARVRRRHARRRGRARRVRRTPVARGRDLRVTGITAFAAYN